MTQHIIRKGDIYMCDLPLTYEYMLYGVHPCIVMSNQLACEHSKSIQIIPLTSKIDKKKLSTHVFIHCGSGNLDYDSIALCEQIQTVDKTLLLCKIGRLSLDIMKQVDRATGMQLNLNRSFNISFALKLVENIKELDMMSDRIGYDSFNSAFRQNILDNLKDYCKVHNIQYDRLLVERGVVE